MMMMKKVQITNFKYKSRWSERDWKSKAKSSEQKKNWSKNLNTDSREKKTHLCVYDEFCLALKKYTENNKAAKKHKTKRKYRKNLNISRSFMIILCFDLNLFLALSHSFAADVVFFRIPLLMRLCECWSCCSKEHFLCRQQMQFELGNDAPAFSTVFNTFFFASLDSFVGCSKSVSNFVFSWALFK